MEESGVFNGLWNLARRASELVSEAVRSDRIHKSTNQYRFNDVVEFDYETRRMTTSPRIETVDEWTFLSLLPLENEIVALGEFIQVLTQLETRYQQQNQGPLDWRLSQFVNRAIADPEHSLADGDLAHLIHRFVQDLEEAELHWTGVALLRGLRLEPDEISVSPGVTLRQTRAEDYVDRQDLGSLITGMFDVGAGRVVRKDSVLELSAVGRTHSEISNEVARALQVFMLYRPVSVASERLDVYSDSVIHTGHISHSLLSGSGLNFQCLLSIADAERLPTFFSQIASLIPDSVLPTREEEPNFVGNAIRRYNDALLLPQPVDARLAAAVMSLEALLLKSNEREELSERLAQRAGKLLGILGIASAAKVYEDIKKAYEHRSTFVHGGHLTGQPLAEASEVITPIVSYVRQIILMMMALGLGPEDDAKNQLLNRISRSLLEPRAEQRLHDQLEAAKATLVDSGGILIRGEVGQDEADEEIVGEGQA